MVGWIILAVVVLLILLVFFVPYGVDILYKKEILSVGIKAGPIVIRILPKKPLSPEKQAKKDAKKARKKAKKEEKASRKKENKGKPKQDETLKVKEKKPLDIQFIFALLKMAAHAIRRFFRSFTIDLFRLYFCAASDDPYNTSLEYGYACALAETLPELCGGVIHIKERQVVIDADYTAQEPEAEVHIALTLQLFKIVHTGVAFAFEFISWKIHHRSSDSVDSERKDKDGRQ